MRKATKAGPFFGDVPPGRHATTAVASPKTGKANHPGSVVIQDHWDDPGDHRCNREPHARSSRRSRRTRECPSESVTPSMLGPNSSIGSAATRPFRVAPTQRRDPRCPERRSRSGRSRDCASHLKHQCLPPPCRGSRNGRTIGSTATNVPSQPGDEARLLLARAWGWGMDDHLRAKQPVGGIPGQTR
jgi:hypothetical protein